jgi:tetratricopeptide (TPR) repeat protein
VIQEKLAADNPAATLFRSHLADSHGSLGNLLGETGRLAEAEVEYRAALAIHGKLADDDPRVPQHRIMVAWWHTVLSVVLRRLGRPAEARDGCDRAIAIREALFQQEVPWHRSLLAWSYRYRGLARRDLGDFAGAAADARQAIALWEGLPSRTGREWFQTACARAALAGLAGPDGSGISAAEGISEADAAMASLRRAVAMGFGSPDILRSEDLDPLRDREDFRLLMMDLAMPADPFARAP